MHIQNKTNYTFAGMHERDWRQQVVVEWGKVAFGEDSACSVAERAERHLEEVVELMQAVGMTPGRAHRLVEAVYDRPVGVIGQEVGGVCVTLLGLCEALHMSAEACERTEITRVLGKDPSVFRRRNAEKKAAGLTTLGDKARQDYRSFAAGDGDSLVHDGVATTGSTGGFVTGVAPRLFGADGSGGAHRAVISFGDNIADTGTFAFVGGSFTK